MKQRITYSQFLEQQKHRKPTLAQLIERFITEMGTATKPGVKPLGATHEISLRALARRPVASKVAESLTKLDWIEHCRARRDKVCAATVNGDVTAAVGVLKYAGAAWADCEGVSHASIEAAKPFLTKHGLIGKSTPRHQRPTDEQHERLIAYFATQNADPATRIDMVKVAEWQRQSSRRIGETCRLEWTHWNREDHTILVTKMKDPKRRNKSKVVALPPGAQAMLERLWETRDPNEPRIFPYCSKSCSARYTLAKKALGITDLRMHDSRRDCGTRLVEDLGYSPAEAILFTGHETVQVFERTYLRMKPELVRHGPLAKRMQAAQVAA